MILDIISKIMTYLDRYDLEKIGYLNKYCREMSRKIYRKRFLKKKSKLYVNDIYKMADVIVYMFFPSSFISYYPEVINGSYSFSMNDLVFYIINCGRFDLAPPISKDILNRFCEFTKKMKPGDLLDFGYNLGIFLYDGKKFIGERSNFRKIAPLLLPEECWKWTEKYGIEFWDEIASELKIIQVATYLPIKTNDEFIINRIMKKKDIIINDGKKLAKIKM